MMTDLCKELRNWFCTGRYFGKFTIEDGALLTDVLQPGQWFRICGSVFNDGVYMYPTEALTDETFDGAIWAMAVPPAVIALSEEIDQWRKKYETVDAMSPYQSESFGGYSYTKGTTASGGSGATWQQAFKARLNQWRKI